MALHGKRAVVLVLWAVVSCLAVHSSQDEKAGPKGEPIKPRSSPTKCLKAVTRDGKHGDVGDSCTKDSECKYSKCDTGNKYHCQGKCVVAHRYSNETAVYNCPVTKSEMTTVIARCDDTDNAQRWEYDRLQGGTLKTPDGKHCLTRIAGQSHITLEPCLNAFDDESKNQKWQRLCGAWANGDGKSGRVLEFAVDSVRGAQWTGEENQLWNFKEVVVHNNCAKKRYKIMKFSGSSDTAAHLKVFLSFPSSVITAMVWIKGTQGTPVSYASKNHLKAFVLKNIKSLEVWIKDTKVDTKVDLTTGNNGNTWVHLAVTWVSETGTVKVYKNGKLSFKKTNINTGKTITPGGCLVLGQAQNKLCGGLTDSYDGEMTDFTIWRKDLGIYDIHRLSVSPVDRSVIKKLGKFDQPTTPKDLRLAFLTRQYSFEELQLKSPPICEMDQFKKKEVPRITHVAGIMPRFSGQGDVHYMNFHHCRYDDQSLGEWVAVQTQREWWAAAPMMLQFRTSPSKTNCPWCQNGAVSYVDGCAIKFGDDHASAGFGGYGMGGTYTPYAAFNNEPMLNTRSMTSHVKKSTAAMTVVASSKYFKATIKAEGVLMVCAQRSLQITLGNKFKGKVEGLGGTGVGPSKDWRMGPNKAGYPETKAGEQMPGLAGHCKRRWQYTTYNSPFNGNMASKALVKWFKSWQVDGEYIMSAFTYDPNSTPKQGPGSFNRKADDKGLKPVKGDDKKPKGAKAKAMEECKALRSTPKAREKCVFDFMMLGSDAIKKSREDRMQQRETKVKKPSKRSVRDVTQFRNDAEWTNAISFECASKFRRFQSMKRREYVKARKVRIENQKEKDAKALFQTQISDASKRAPCPTGFRTAWHPSAFKEQVASEKKECAIGMLAVDAKAKAAHIRSNKQSLSLVSKFYLNGKDLSEEEATLLGDSAEADPGAAIGAVCSKDADCQTKKCDTGGQYKCKNKCLITRAKRSKGPLENCPDFEAAARYEYVSPKATGCEAGYVALSFEECQTFAQFKEFDEFQALKFKGPVGCTYQTKDLKGGKKGSIYFNAQAEATASDTYSPVCKRVQSKNQKKEKKQTKTEQKVDSGREETTDPEGAEAAFLSAGGEIFISGSTQPEEETDLGDAISLLSLNDAPPPLGVEAWGDSKSGGDIEPVTKDLKNVVAIASTQLAFAAVMENGKVMAWGSSSHGASSSAVNKELNRIDSLYATCCAFAALRKDGKVITWGDKKYGGDTKPAAHLLAKGTRTITGTERAFAAATYEGKLVAWGDSNYGGDATQAQKELVDSTGVKSISATSYAFAVLTKSRRRSSVVTWGNPQYGGKYSDADEKKFKDVKQVFGNKYAFAALTDHGTVVTWGSSGYGGNSASVQSHLKNVVTIIGTNSAFAALKADGSVVTWGRSDRGGNSGAARHFLKSGITSIIGTRGAFLAMSKDGTTINWGDKNFGGNPKKVTQAVSAAATSDAFSVIRKSGEVVHITRPAPPPQAGQCHYSQISHNRPSQHCTSTGLECRYMKELSSANRRGRRPDRWSKLNDHGAGTYIYMERWVGGCGSSYKNTWAKYGHGHWCSQGRSNYNEFALCASGPGENGKGGIYVSTFKGYRYYRVKVQGQMSSQNIYKTCTENGYVTPCPGPGGKAPDTSAAVASRTAKMKGLKQVFGNSKAFVALKEQVSSLCQHRIGPDGRSDGRCDDGWQDESKSKGEPVCEDDNNNKMIPCSALMYACADLAVQAKCAMTCGTLDRGSEECKAIGQALDKYKCSRKFSCSPEHEFVKPSGLEWLKTNGRPSSGCGSSVAIKVAQCSSDKEKVECGCPSAYNIQTKSLTMNDCDDAEYKQEGSKILDLLTSMASATSQWATSCSALRESADSYVIKPKTPENLKMKNGKVTIWEMEGLHAQTLSQKADGCFYEFTMTMAICKTPPFRDMVLMIPSTGSQLKTVGCGCQEMLVHVKYDAQMLGMENKMQTTQDVCAANFAKWTLHYQKEYFFAGLGYQSHAIRLAKEIKKQCRMPGTELSPEKAYEHKEKSLAFVMGQNSQAIRQYESEVQETESKLMRLQKKSAQCQAKLPPKHEFSKNGYQKLVDKISTETGKAPATTLQYEAIALKTRLDRQDNNTARLKMAQSATP